MAAAALPIASSFLAPEIAGSIVAPMLGSSLAASAPWLAPAIAGAGLGGIGSLLTGGDPLQGALFGGIGSGITSQIFPKGLGGMFGGGSEAVTDDVLKQSFPNQAAANAARSAAGVSGAASGAASNGISNLLPYAGIAGGAMLLDNMMAPKEVGPPMKEDKTGGRKAMPLDRMMQPVDPQSYLTAGGNRSHYAPYSLEPSYFAKGGIARYSSGGSSSASSSNIPVRGRGDGKSDSIPAMLSDGEFVVSAPVVSALGNGSNDAGARKLAKMQKTVLRDHYKGGKPKKSMGIGGYVH